MNIGEFIEAIAPGAKQQMKATGILASLTMAQAILESGKGQSELAQDPNFNLFGIKGAGTAGSVSLPTQEWDGSKMVDVVADFRKYNSWEESIADHNSLFTRLSRYHNLINEPDYRRACVLVQKDGYATDPEYANKLIRIIESYGLAAYDQETIVEKSIPEWGIEARSDLTNLGITDGSRPMDPALRIEAWTMLHKAIQILDGRIPDKVAQAIDAIPPKMIPEDVPEWAKDSIAALQELGITDGSRPNYYATRAELAVMLQRAMVEMYHHLAYQDEKLRILEAIDADPKLANLDDRETELRQRVTDIEDQLEQKGIIGRMVDLILKPFRKLGDGA